MAFALRVLSEQSHAHYLPTSYRLLLSFHNVIVATETKWPQLPEIFTVWMFTEMSFFMSAFHDWAMKMIQNLIAKDQTFLSTALHFHSTSQPHNENICPMYVIFNEFNLGNVSRDPGQPSFNNPSTLFCVQSTAQNPFHSVL